MRLALRSTRAAHNNSAFFDGSAEIETHRLAQYTDRALQFLSQSQLLPPYQ